MKTNRKHEIIILALSILPFIVCMIAYPFLPDSIPMQFDFSGAISRYGSKLELFLLPVLGIVTNLLLKKIPNIDPKKENYNRFGKSYSIFRIGFAAFFCLIILLPLYLVFSSDLINVTKFIFILLGALFCLIGNFMPKFKPTYFCGIRSPWTLASEVVWRKTHRISGILWFLVGALLIVAALFFPLVVSSPIFVLFIILPLAVIPYCISYFIYKKEEKN